MTGRVIHTVAAYTFPLKTTTLLLSGDLPMNSRRFQDERRRCDQGVPPLLAVP